MAPSLSPISMDIAALQSAERIRPGISVDELKPLGKVSAIPITLMVDRPGWLGERQAGNSQGRTQNSLPECLK